MIRAGSHVEERSDIVKRESNHVGTKSFAKYVQKTEIMCNRNSTEKR